jgi:hypothetical protein
LFFAAPTHDLLAVLFSGDIAAPPGQTPFAGVQSLSAERSLRDAVDKAALLQLGKGALSGPARDVASLGSPANRKAKPAVVYAVVAPSDFDEDGTGLATQREVGQSSIQR